MTNRKLGSRRDAYATTGTSPTASAGEVLLTHNFLIEASTNRQTPYRFVPVSTISRALRIAHGIPPVRTRAALDFLAAKGLVQRAEPEPGFRGQRGYRVVPRVVSDDGYHPIAPIVGIKAPIRQGNPRTVLVACPWCGETHRHGGGNVDMDETEAFGTRVPHCATSFYSRNPTDYDVRALTPEQARYVFGGGAR